jgi:hypothetical protein
MPVICGSPWPWSAHGCSETIDPFFFFFFFGMELLQTVSEVVSRVCGTYELWVRVWGTTTVLGLMYFIPSSVYI